MLKVLPNMKFITNFPLEKYTDENSRTLIEVTHSTHFQVLAVIQQLTIKDITGRQYYRPALSYTIPIRGIYYA